MRRRNVGVGSAVKYGKYGLLNGRVLTFFLLDDLLRARGWKIY
jgi:hypothetical protein